VLYFIQKCQAEHAVQTLPNGYTNKQGKKKGTVARAPQGMRGSANGVQVSVCRVAMTREGMRSNGTQGRHNTLHGQLLTAPTWTNSDVNVKAGQAHPCVAVLEP